MLSNDNHLFTTQGHQQATDKDLTTFKRDINKKFDGFVESQARLEARMEDSHARLEARMVDSHATLNERIEYSRASIENLSATMKKFMSSFDNSARQRQRSRSRSSRSSSHSNHVDDHVRLQQPRPLPQTHPQHDAPRRDT
jgi:hypothetical protein